MSVLLRHPAAVPALFARATEPETASDPGRRRRPRRPALDAATLAVSVWALVVLIEIPLARAAVLGLALSP